MLRRFHTRILVVGSLCGLPSSPPAEVFLKSLPPPKEVDYAKYCRFEREEKERQQTSECRVTETLREPFYDICCGAAGHKHVVLMTREGNLITFGDNRYGQAAAPKQEQSRDDGNEFQREKTAMRVLDTCWAPLYVDLDGAFSSGDKAVACGSNYTIVYQPGGRRAIAFGNNHMGQLGVGHKRQIDSDRGFAEWNSTATWWGHGRSVIRNIVCGFNHTVLQLSCGALLSFGSNTWGELGIGSTVSPIEPTPIHYFDDNGLTVAKVAAGNSFSLFLTSDGRVYGCGATNFGQLPPNEFEPVPLPITRGFQHNTQRAGTKLIRIRDIACVGSMAAFVSNKNELFVQGGLPEYGFHVHSPRFLVVDQQPVVEQFCAKLFKVLHVTPKDGDFEIVRLIQGPSTLLVVYRNGCVAGLGANTEGQLQNIQRSGRGKKVNLAKAFAADSLFPVLFPTRELFKTAGYVPWFACGSGFTLFFDNDEVYSADDVMPVELPPASYAKKMKAALW